MENQEKVSELEERVEKLEFCLGCGEEFWSDELKEGLCRQCQKEEKRQDHSHKATRSKRDYRYE